MNRLRHWIRNLEDGGIIFAIGCKVYFTNPLELEEKV